jgi:hypothetical protein
VIVDARLIDTVQTCQRRVLLEADYRVSKWRPKSLADAILRRAVLRLSSGDDPVIVADAAKASYLEVAASPGIEVRYGQSPYPIAKEYCALLDSVIRSIARTPLLTLHEPSVVPISTTTSWRPLAMSDDSGSLHRWITVERWDADALSRELHGWYVFGDVAMTGMPMTLHVVSIGRVRDGRRESSWTRGWRNPAAPNLKLRFLRAPDRHKDRQEFHGWMPEWLSDGKTKVEDWVDRMWEDGAAQKLLHVADVRVPSDLVIADTKRQVVIEAERIRGLLEARSVDRWKMKPMSRGACDDRIAPCPWQQACYRDGESATDVVALGPYIAIEDASSLRIPQEAEPSRRLAVPQKVNIPFTQIHGSMSLP